jgi:hypothetical protein
MRRVAGPALACLIPLLGAAPLAAQTSGGMPDPAPSGGAPGFLSRYAFHLNAAFIDQEDRTRFAWDADLGGEVDLVDYDAGRITLAANYEAILGMELQTFDPNQGNYTLAASGSVRLPPGEVAAVFHHVSRHFSDRPKPFPIDWNMVGVRFVRGASSGRVRVDGSARALFAVKRSFVDYSSEIGAGVRLTVHAGGLAYVFGGGDVTRVGVDPEIAGRTTQVGGRGEGGLRIARSGGAVELFLSLERRIDAEPLAREPRTWMMLGFRLLGN